MTEEVTQSAATPEEGSTPTVETPDFLGMSDADFANVDPNTMESPAVPEVGAQSDEVSDPEEKENETEGEAAQEGQGIEGEGETGEESAKDPEEVNSELDTNKPDPDSGADESEILKRLLGEFKANGRDMKVETVEEARQLMQMGANYNKKMAGLKPSLRILKMLENNKLLDEGKLNYLIDLSNKKPDAINKFVKESGVDPLDIDESKVGEYKPTDHSVNDNVVELDEVISQINETDSGKQTLDIIGTKWDNQSQQMLAQNPGSINLINDHVSTGVYDVVSTEVEKRRMLGQMTGVPDLTAYQSVGQELAQAGKLNHLIKAPKPTGNVQTPATEKPRKPQETEVQAKARQQKKRAASPTRNSGSATDKTPDFNPLALSDEEFAKLNPKFI